MFRYSLRTEFRRIWLAAFICLFCIFSTALVPSAVAHNLDQSYLYFQVTEETISARAEVPILDLNEILQLALPTNRPITRDDIKPHLAQIKSYMTTNMDVRCPPEACQLLFQDYGVLNAKPQFLKLTYKLKGFQSRPDELRVKYDVILADKDKITNMLLIEQHWNAGTFGNEANPLLIVKTPGKAHTVKFSSGSFWQGFFAIVQLGILHILEGIDHVLFLAALLLPSVMRREANRWQPVSRFSSAFIYVCKIATAFTVAHSITLGLATLQIVQLPSRLVESAIAISIGLAAIEIFYPIFKGRTWLVVFVFGLFHGFGFAEIISQRGIISQHALISLFGFNLGVEIGQLAIIMVMFPLLYFLSKQRWYPRLIMKLGGFILGILSLYWFIERAFNINIPWGQIIKGLS